MTNVVEVNGIFAIIKVEARDSSAEALILADVKPIRKLKINIIQQERFTLMS